ncbi:hypothetical protein EMIHUDRAFT_467008 [Emiliania huxleyi CCMP1516]|uniref:Cyclic nucleotide-binding domain-containing protein n=2 Tax=Emiliania huxleyi TaxID=2903 RepID=A0A0D3KPL2_EMIH1|nr:hypothetical protein EMIHUDRAFT_467008 [Emiliania huxleyi CCMP1516]EOD37697.1 hypothetical protein EMIHUDRAFT_467008 [Emiliania huxleyi CCMP1516]|eukprot:XP_005790126.1 hypothetical protein EMIHUDRAFT_467008 [Emiliania huxleyi CCMP1516]
MHVSGAEAEGSLLRSLHLLSSQRYLRNLLDEVSRRPLQYNEAEPAGSSNAAAMRPSASAPSLRSVAKRAPRAPDEHARRDRRPPPCPPVACGEAACMRYDVLWRERAPASAFYIIASGSIELRQRQPSMEGEEATRDVSVCKPGDLIGHAALVLRPRGCPIKRQCVAMAAERTWLLGVSRPDLEACAPVREALFWHGSGRRAEALEIAAMLRRSASPLFGEASPSDLLELAGRFAFYEVTSGQQLQAAGAAPACFSILVAGTVAMSRTAADGADSAWTLTEASASPFLGEEVVLAGYSPAAPARVTAIAAETCSLLCLPVAEEPLVFRPSKRAPDRPIKHASIEKKSFAPTTMPRRKRDTAEAEAAAEAAAAGSNDEEVSGGEDEAEDSGDSSDEADLEMAQADGAEKELQVEFIFTDPAEEDTPYVRSLLAGGSLCTATGADAAGLAATVANQVEVGTMIKADGALFGFLSAVSLQRHRADPSVGRQACSLRPEAPTSASSSRSGWSTRPSSSSRTQ